MMFSPALTFGLREIYRRDGISQPEDNAAGADLRDIPAFPLTLHIETTSFCDNNCVFCTRQDFSRQPMHMSRDLFAKIIDECAQRGELDSIHLFKDGDPILTPELPWMIRYARARRAARSLIVATGANALTPELSDEIISSGLDDICFSVDALTEEQYRAVKGTGNYGRVLKNIFEFIKIRERAQTTKPHVTVKMLATNQTQEDIDMFVRMWINLADSVLIDREFSFWDGTCDGVNATGGALAEQAYPKEGVRHPCNRPWYMLSIFADGKVTICPEDWAQRMVIGDLAHQSLYEIWHGDRLHEIKRMHIDGECDVLGACARCKAHHIKNLGDWFVLNRDKALIR